MKNYVQPGLTLTIISPKDRVSGALVIDGGLVGVAGFDAKRGEELVISMAGVFELPKVEIGELRQGAIAYYDQENDLVTGEAGTGAQAKPRIGIIVEAASGKTCKVRLDG